MSPDLIEQCLAVHREIVLALAKLPEKYEASMPGAHFVVGQTEVSYEWAGSHVRLGITIGPTVAESGWYIVTGLKHKEDVGEYGLLEGRSPGLVEELVSRLAELSHKG